MKVPIVFMYSGQGSQYFQMGADLYEHHPRFRLWMNYCAELSRPMLGDCSLIDVIYRQGEKQTPFDRLFYSNPALIAIQYSLTRVLMEEGVKPAYTMGYSLGELVAAIVSGCIDIEQGLNLSIRCAQLLETKTPVAKMLAVVANRSLYDEKSELFLDVWLTGNNCDTNFVVTGLVGSVDKLIGKLEEMGISCVTLPVRYGFHTELIECIRDEFDSLFAEITIKQAKIPMFSLRSSELIREVSGEYFWEVFRNPVDFATIIPEFIKKGFDTFVDVGPSASLATFLKYIGDSHSFSTLEVHSTLNQFGNDRTAVTRLKFALLPAAVI